MLHEEILTKKQKELVSVVEEFAGAYYLVGGTALALQLGHRRSVDFDLFTRMSFDNNRIIEIVEKKYSIDEVHVNEKDQLTLMVHGVKMTWYRYEYEIAHDAMWGKMEMPSPMMIGVMKAFAIGRRAKWKDYVDLYFLIKKYSFGRIVEETSKVFGERLFDEALLRAQLSYYDDVDYREVVEFLPGWEVDDSVVRDYLAEVASTE